MPEFSLNKYVPDSTQYWAVGAETGASALPFESKEILAKVMNERLESLRSEIDSINTHLRQRARLRDALQSGIREDMCHIQNRVYELNTEDSGSVIPLEKLLAGLSKERRQQEYSHWQDTVMLKRDLRKAEKELRSAVLDLWMVRFVS